LVLSDVVLASLLWGVALLIQSMWGQGEITRVALASTVPNVAVWLGLRALLGLYPGYGVDEVEELRRQTYAVMATLAITAVFAVAFHIGGSLSRLLLFVGFAGLLVLAPFVRHFMKAALKRAGVWGKPVVVIGAGEAGGRLLKTLREEWRLGFRPAAVFDNRLVPAGGALEGVPYGGNLEDAMSMARKHKLDTAIFAMPHTRREELAPLVSRASVSFRHVMVIPNLGGITNSAVVARNFAGTFGVEIKHNLLDPWARRTKRALDLFGVVVGGLMISPILLAITLLIKLDSPGPALFVQKRPGRNGDMFRIFKFRTMYSDAEQRFEQLVFGNPLLAGEFERHGKLRDDPRVTRVGKWLRKLSLDELPQLWNVLKGDMSLVGPRPYLVSQVAQIKGSGMVIPQVAPGITGLWQVSGRSEITFEQRVDLDAYYVRNWSTWLDFVLLARTVRCVLLRRGAY
jgi:Undecaprenyl-phosphate galactose phosphotransferase WbaP